MWVCNRMRLPALLLALLPVAAAAETPITADAFEAHVTGKTLTYRQYDFIFGTEEYLPGRKVRWSVMPGECQYGNWYPQDEDICFAYEGSPVPACWTFWLRNGTLVALSVNADAGAELYEIEASAKPLPCPGPDVGV
jgi:hypothetical protein